MKFKKDSDFKIAKATIDTVFTKNESIDHGKWIEFVNTHEGFIWYEDTRDGKNSLSNIDRVPEKFRARVQASLNKVRCYLEFDAKKDNYNINISFNSRDNWISIGFERVPKIEDLEVFVEMASHLDALLLLDGTTIVNEELLNELSPRST